MSRSPSLRRACVATTAALTLLGGSLAAAPAATAASPRLQTTAIDAPRGGLLNPVPPARLLDTRTQGGAVQAGTPRELVVLGQAGVPSSGVSAVVLNVTVTGGSERSDLQVYPVGQRPPRRTSNLNWHAGQSVPVQVQTAVGDGGRVAFSVHSGSAHVVVDVFGWYGDGSESTTTDGDSGYTALSPARLLDTRVDGGRVVHGEPRTVQVVGNAGVPTGAAAVMLNATLLDTNADADLQVFPIGMRPEQRTSNLNVRRGETRANAVVAPIGEDGSIGLSISRNLSVDETSGHVVLDVLGYYSPDSPARFVSLSPSRILDTRDTADPVPAGSPRTPRIANRGAVPLNADAAVLNVTATAASQPLDLQVYPVGSRPERRTSNLNLRPGTAVPNLAVATLGTDGQIGLSASHGAVHVVLDVLGYFTRATWSTCTNPQDGWAAQFPGHWRMNPAGVVEPCSLFDPEPIALPGEPQEIPLDIAVQMRREAIAVDDARTDDASTQISEVPTTVDGRPAYRQEREQTRSTTIPEGTRYTVWLVDLEGETLIATSYDVGEPAYADKVAVLDEMMSRLEIADDATQPTAVRVAAVDADGRVVVLDGQSGEVRRVLMEGVRVDDPASNAIAVSPDREQVYVVRPGTSGGDSDIVRVSTSGGEPELVATGTSPALSPDGGTLAYAQLVDDGQAGFEPVLRLRDLTTGQERELRSESDAFYAIQGIAWTEDGTRLAFTDGEIKLGLHVIPATATSLDEARRLGPESTDASWEGVASLGADRLAVIEICCGTLESPERWRVIEVDASTGAVGAEVFGRDRTEATLVDDRKDAAGLLVVQGGDLGGNPLLRWDGSGELRQIADRIVVAAW